VTPRVGGSLSVRTVVLRRQGAHRARPLRSAESAILVRIVPYRLSTEEFVGRRAELALFDRAIVDARRGLPSVLLIGGDAGIGKTTLVSEGASRADVALYLGRSTHIGGETIPLAPLADLLRQVRRAAPDLLIEPAQVAALQHWLRPDTVIADGSQVSRGGLFVAVLDLIARLALDDAIVVAFDDLHWADTVTWDLFEYLARNRIDEHVVLAATYRAN